ncbi:MAG: right-handed parallel beta-helix repeat-containing protein [Archaeoglobus sp.]|uniref:right-handed parallel beta-helix repeat-containing protein n=1 Tax=Archaeoglobus sp. TaxID=1872626 RepID=UPI001DF46E22|nr:right-handed parallel beta-helix repeat-containing protein [Archaeoglobus sp.]MBO8181097.1 right-handed parallel beta-helix repeat-containing protein [Archaeoglobus sp.]
MESTNPSNKKVVITLQGEFELDSTINLTSNTVLDMRNAYLKLTDNTNLNMIKASDVQNIEIVGGILDGNKDNQDPSEVQWEKRGIVLYNVTNAIIRDVIIQNTTRDGIAIHKGSDIIVKNVKVINSGFQGFALRYNAHDIKLSNCVAEGCANVGFDIGQTYNVQLENCTARNNGQHGIASDWANRLQIVNSLAEGNSEQGFQVGDSSGTHTPYDVTISNCRSYNNTGKGFNIINGAYNVTVVSCIARLNGDSGFRTGRDCHSISFGSCIADSNGNRGFSIENSYDIVIVGCEVWNNGQSTTADGIIITGDATTNATGIRIIACKASDSQPTKTQRYGVNVSGTEDYNIVALCDLRGNATGGLNGLSGANDISANNLT